MPTALIQSSNTIFTLPPQAAAGRCAPSQSAEADILAALEGNYRPEYLFVLGQIQTQWDEIRGTSPTLTRRVSDTDPIAAAGS